MPKTAAQLLFIESFLSQITGLESWLSRALTDAGIDGAPARRAKTRLTELRDEIVDVCGLIVAPQSYLDLSKLTTYKDFDASQLFPSELVKRADDGIQDLGSGIQDELAGIASGRKSELEARVTLPLTVNSMATWSEMCACDCIEEIASTVMRLAEAARYLFQMEFLRVISLVQEAQLQSTPVKTDEGRAA